MTTTRWKVVCSENSYQVRDENDNRICSIPTIWPAQKDLAHQIVREHNATVEEAEHPELVIDKYFEDYSKLKRANAAMVEALETYAHDGRLQTFEDRQRFRKAAQAALRVAKGDI